MISLEEYIIPYLGLKNGEHKFQYHLDNGFFAHFETSKITEADLSVDILFDRRDSVVTVSIACEGTFNATCDRCTSQISIPMAFDDRVIIKLEEEKPGEEVEVVFMDPNTSHIDLAPHIYEAVHVHLPIQNLKDCEADEYQSCDHEVLDRLEGEEHSSDGDSDADEMQGNIWSELDKLNLN